MDDQDRRLRPRHLFRRKVETLYGRPSELAPILSDVPFVWKITTSPVDFLSVGRIDNVDLTENRPELFAGFLWIIG
jgi:hypothetical protein